MSKPNIVVLDGHALNPGDLSWEPLDGLGNIIVYPRTQPSKVVARAQKAEVVLTNKSVLGAEQLAQLPKLKFISVLATGVNTVDVSFAKQQGLTISNVVGYSSPSVAQHTIALLLELANRVGHHAHQVSLDKWSRSDDWSYWDFPLKELKDKTLGIVGLGNIGQQVAKIGLGFGMNILSVSGRGNVDEGMNSVTRVPMAVLLSESDVISLNCPLNAETHHLINRESLSSMKPQAFLINTARGPLINEQDLKWALENKVIAGAGVDVLEQEPPPAKHPLIGLPNCIITPHQAWASLESRTRLMEESVLNVQSYLKGIPRNVVSG